jgi:hypothetical protein
MFFYDLQKGKVPSNILFPAAPGGRYISVAASAFNTVSCVFGIV